MQTKPFLAFAILLSLTAPAAAQPHTRGGATLGGVAGAIAGGIIGHQNDETPEGALIGGAIGAIAGGVLGNARDNQVARENYYRHQIWQHQQRQAYQQQSQQQLGLVSMGDVVTLAQSGVSDSVIINHIHNRGVQRRPETQDIIALHQQGVSEPVITAMQRAAPSQPTVVATRVEHRPVVVHERRPVVVHHEYRPAPRRYVPATPTYRRVHAYHTVPGRYHRY